MIIVFSGLDCSGKSTQIGILKERLDKKNIKNLVFWSRGGYTPGIQFLKDLVRKTSGSKLPKSGKSEKRTKAFENSRVRKIWLSLAILDLIFYYAIYMRFKKCIGYHIICDRYIEDTAIDFKLNFPQENVANWTLWRVLNKMALKPNYTFISLVPVSTSIERSKNKFEPFPDSPETLERRLYMYEKIIKENKKSICINGLDKIENITAKIKNKISF